MSMTPWPYDITPGAVQDTYNFLSEHVEVVTHHFDNGVPWTETIYGLPFPSGVQNEIDFRTAQLPGKPIYLALSAMNIDRSGLAPYWGTEPNQPLPPWLANKKFNHSTIVNGYLNYCIRMIDAFNPSYVCFGAESNVLQKQNPSAFADYVSMISQIYPWLKQRFPSIPIFLSFHIETLLENPAARLPAIQSLLPYSDWMGVSTYPYIAEPNPDLLPIEWFSVMRDLAPTKPFAVAETGFIAEDYQVNGVTVVPGNEFWQAAYVARLLSQCSELDAKLVNWFVPRDFDAMYAYLESINMPGYEKLRLFRDTGLLAGDGSPRVALGYWDTWRGVPYTG